MKARTINIKPYHCEVSCGSTGFVWSFYQSGKVIRIHFEYWWVAFLARNLWNCVKKQEAMAAYSRAAMTKAEP